MARSRLSRTWCLPRPTTPSGPARCSSSPSTPTRSREGTPRSKSSSPGSTVLSPRAAPPGRWSTAITPSTRNGEHGGDRNTSRAPPSPPLLAKHKVDVYLAGHDHDLEILKPDEGVRFLVSGGGGKGVRPLRTRACRDWAASRLGFTVLDAGRQDLAATFYGTNGEHSTRSGCAKARRFRTAGGPAPHSPHPPGPPLSQPHSPTPGRGGKRHDEGVFGWGLPSPGGREGGWERGRG